MKRNEILRKIARRAHAIARNLDWRKSYAYKLSWALRQAWKEAKAFLAGKKTYFGWFDTRHEYQDTYWFRRCCSIKQAKYILYLMSQSAASCIINAGFADRAELLQSGLTGQHASQIIDKLKSGGTVILRAIFDYEDEKAIDDEWPIDDNYTFTSSAV